jgi:glutamate-5-semialdehyde dehydrogenase
VEPIVLNAKVQRPSACNAVETLLVHADVADKYLPSLIAALKANNVVIVGDEATRQYDASIELATEEDYATEFLDFKIAIKVVKDVNEAIKHIARFGTMHTEAIISNDTKAIEAFEAKVDAAAIMVNASTRFTDGFEFGFGAEIGISSQKMHARGPMGLRELTTYKYIVRGNGQIR